MAALDINDALPMCFDFGGILTINDGTDTGTMFNIEPGSLEVQEGGYEPREYQDRSVNKTPLKGKERPSTINFRLKDSKAMTEAKNVYALADQTDATGVVKTFTVVIKVPHAGTGGSTGDQITFAGCYFEPRPRRVPGAEFDIIEVSMKSTTAVGTKATY